MVSPELLRRYSFFGGLSMDHIVELAKVASEIDVEEGGFFFHEGDDLNFLYLVVDGDVEILVELVEKGIEIVTSVVVPGEVFGWSALLPPHTATASAKAKTDCRLVAFDCIPLRQQFEADSYFGFVITQRLAQVMRERLNALRIESLAYSNLHYST